MTERKTRWIMVHKTQHRKLKRLSCTNPTKNLGWTQVISRVAHEKQSVISQILWWIVSEEKRFGIVTTKNRTHSWASLTQIFRNIKPSRHGDHKNYKLLQRYMSWSQHSTDQNAYKPAITIDRDWLGLC